ncbi:PIN domain-like protein, partial [Atractiella rhizophila]
MGIKGLTNLIADVAPKAMKEAEIKTLFGRKVAIDASMSIYQFLIAVRQQDGQQLMNDAGETTSHLMGLFYRTIRMVENGIKPVYVFDGKPPQLKSGVLSKRFEKREEAKEEGEDAKEIGTTEDIDKLSRRQVKVTREHNEECRKLLKLMGIPYIDAPSEAEAQCAELCRGGIVYGAGSEDMDTLTFNSPILLRHLTFSEARKMPISIIKLEDVLKGMDISMDTFIDLCMLSGCDYLEPLKGVGAKKAYKMLQDHGDIESVLEHLKGSKNPPPDEWPWQEAKELFKKPDVIPADQCDVKWDKPDIEGLVDFLVKDKGFNEDRVRKAAEKINKQMNAPQQGRLDGFFKVQPSTSSGNTSKKEKEKEKGKKRKKGDDEEEGKSK